MPKHVLFVCKSCKSASIQKGDRTEGSRLFEELLALHQDWSRKSELEIQSVSCLWTCSHPCTVALSSANNKFTYMVFTDLSPSETAPALLNLCEFYLDSHDGDLPWDKFPSVLQEAGTARIPPVPQG
jgi:predicted metal-binding protein